MRLTVCELRTSHRALEQDWDGSAAHLAEQRSAPVTVDVDVAAVDDAPAD